MRTRTMPEKTVEQILSPVRSFVKRQSRLTQAQARALEKLLPLYQLPLPVDMVTLFSHTAPLVLEIGFGMGASLAETAKQTPEQNFVGVEVHAPGVGALLLAIEQLQLTNLRIHHGDIIELLPHLPNECFDKIQIFFPDPWPKKRHHKRRLIQEKFIHQILPLLKPNGILHLATDWENYALHMLTVLQQVRELSNLSPTQDFHPRPTDRLLTKYEARGEKLGHDVWDLLFVKQA